MKRTLLAQLVLGAGLTATASLAGCTRDKPASSSSSAPAPAPGAQPAPGAPGAGASMNPHGGGGPAGPAGDRLTGTVLETMGSGGYTYAKLNSNGMEVWAAGPQTKLAVGDKVDAAGGTLMTGFRSETLNRTFDQIWFVGSFSGGGAAGGGDPRGGANPHAGGAAPAPTTVTEKIAPAEGGVAIAEVFAAKAQLAGKPVTVRGKVVKVNNGIMGRNWLHLQDGTGAPGSNDLLVTSDATAKLGDVVVARGTLAVDKDFGGGYAYDLVVEGATLEAR